MSKGKLPTDGPGTGPEWFSNKGSISEDQFLATWLGACMAKVIIPSDTPGTLPE